LTRVPEGLKPRMNLRLVTLVASLVANVALAAIIAIQRSPSSRPPVAKSDIPVPTTVRKDQTPEARNSGATAASLEAVPGFRWSQLESEDYQEYIIRLRNFGVPEKVIRDIIIADVQKLYRPRFAALRPPKKPADPNFWERRNQGYYPNRDQTKEQRDQTRALQKEQTELIKTLLGAEVYDQISKESGHPDWTERMYGPLSKETREKISEIQERFQEAQADIYARADGFIDQETQAELAGLRRVYREQLAGILPLEQLQEYEVRSSEVAQRMKWELAWFEPDEKEFRAIHTVKQLQDEINGLLNPGIENTDATRAQIKALQERQAELDKAVTETLGTNRAREYQLANQWEYRNLLEAGVAKENVIKVADLRGEVELAAQKLRQDKSLSNEQRTEALRAIKAETEKTLTEMLGERRVKYYTSSSGSWLRNLAPSP